MDWTGANGMQCEVTPLINKFKELLLNKKRNATAYPESQHNLRVDIRFSFRIFFFLLNLLANKGVENSPVFSSDSKKYNLAVQLDFIYFFYVFCLLGYNCTLCLLLKISM